MNLKTLDDLIVALQVKIGNVKDLRKKVEEEINEEIEEFIMCEPNLFKMKDFDEVIKLAGHKKEELDELFECIYFNKNDTYFEMTEDGCFGSFSVDPKFFFEQLEDIEKVRIFKEVLEKYSGK